MAILSDGCGAWLFRLVLVPLACAGAVAFLSSGGGYPSVSGLQVSAKLAAPVAEVRWATPEEFLSGKGGLAADFVVAKYFALRDIGISASRLRVFVAGRKGSTQPHFVLAY